MFYFILLVLAGYMIAMGIRANVLNLEIQKITQAEAYNDEQISVWHELGGFNMLLLEFGPNTAMSFLAGAGALIAYLGIWMCVLGSPKGLIMVILGAAACGLVQYTMITKIKDYFTRYEKELGEDPRPYFTGKNGVPHAVYTSVMIGIGKAVKFILLVSVVGILLYVILRNAALRIIDFETMTITEDYQFPPKIIYDEYGNQWHCTDIMGEDKNIKVYSPMINGRLNRSSRIYVDSNKILAEKPNAAKIIVGARVFHW